MPTSVSTYLPTYRTFLPSYYIPNLVRRNYSKVGQKWYQSPALSLLFRRVYFFFIYLNGYHPSKLVKPVLAIKDHKN
jgi:hypothetical protein